MLLVIMNCKCRHEGCFLFRKNSGSRSIDVITLVICIAVIAKFCYCSRGKIRKNIFLSTHFVSLDGVSGNSIDVSIWVGNSSDFKYDNKHTLIECVIVLMILFVYFLYIATFVLVFRSWYNVCLKYAFENDGKRG